MEKNNFSLNMEIRNIVMVMDKENNLEKGIKIFDVIRNKFLRGKCGLVETNYEKIFFHNLDNFLKGIIFSCEYNGAAVFGLDNEGKKKIKIKSDLIPDNEKIELGIFFKDEEKNKKEKIKIKFGKKILPDLISITEYFLNREILEKYFLGDNGRGAFDEEKEINSEKKDKFKTDNNNYENSIAEKINDFIYSEIIPEENFLMKKLFGTYEDTLINFFKTIKKINDENFSGFLFYPDFVLDKNSFPFLKNNDSEEKKYFVSLDEFLSNGIDPRAAVLMKQLIIPKLLNHHSTDYEIPLIYDYKSNPFNKLFQINELVILPLLKLSDIFERDEVKIDTKLLEPEYFKSQYLSLLKFAIDKKERIFNYLFGEMGFDYFELEKLVNSFNETDFEKIAAPVINNPKFYNPKKFIETFLIDLFKNFNFS
jgi:hypothetical protein